MTSRLRNRLVIRVDEEVIREAVTDYVNAVVLKLLTEKGYSKQAFVKTMAKAWKVKEDDFLELAGGVFLVKLRSSFDQKRIMEGGPWNYMNQLVGTRCWEAWLAAFEYDFNKCSVWEQVYNIPPELMEGTTTEIMANKCAEALGKLKGFVVSGNNKRKFLRIRVEIDIRLPLCSGVSYERRTRQDLWLQFKFERMPFFCYRCGKIGHESKGCNDPEPAEDFEELGPWMRAEATDGEWSGNGVSPRKDSDGGRCHGNRESSVREESSGFSGIRDKNLGGREDTDEFEFQSYEENNRKQKNRDEMVRLEPVLENRFNDEISEVDRVMEVDQHALMVVAGKEMR